jgi:small nuclear ribonucleoprotein (snRNP)-like protein
VPWSSPVLAWASAVTGVLKGYDQLMNVVLDEAVEYLRGGQQRQQQQWTEGRLCQLACPPVTAASKGSEIWKNSLMLWRRCHLQH